MTQHALDDHDEFSAHHIRLQLSSREDGQINSSIRVNEQGYHKFNAESGQHDHRDVALTVRLIRDDSASKLESSLRQHSTVLEVKYPPNQIPSVTSSASPLSDLLVTKLEEVFSEEKSLIRYILGNPQLSAPSNPSVSRDSRSRHSTDLDPETQAKLSTRMTRSLKYAATYHLTFSLFTPTAAPSSWDIEAAISEYIAPLLRSLSVVSNFTVDTQIQLHARLAPSTPAPQYDAEAGVWVLRQEDLSSFLNAAEWPLSPSIGAGPTLNFVVYVPSPETSPLVVAERHATSWLIPQWGGVVIHNSRNATESSRYLGKERLRPALLTFAHQLLSFMGAPESPLSLPLQLRTLVRVQALSLLLSASATMGSLARLTVALPSIAIPETVSVAVDSTLTHLRQTCAALKTGRFQMALEHARTAEAHAEKGFFEKSMVGQVYFPDEHKVAVYLPLLGPVGVPLIMSAAKEIRRILTARRAARTTR